MSYISYSGTVLKIDNKVITLPYKILEAFESKGVVVLLLDPDANLGKTGQYRNLIAYDPSATKNGKLNYLRRKFRMFIGKLSIRRH